MKKRIKLCVNGMTENEQIRGPVRVIVELVARLDTDLFDIVLIAGAWQKNTYHSLEDRVSVRYFDIPRSKVPRALFYIFVMPWILWSRAIAVYHLPDTNPMPLFRGKTKVVSTIHDMAEFVVPYRFSRVQAAYRRLISRRQAHASDCLITDSEYSRNEISRFLDVKKEDLDVIYLGVSALDQAVERGEAGIVSAEIRYILYVGVLENAKNVDRLVKAFGSLPEQIRKCTRLRLVGKKANAYAHILEIIADDGIREQVEILGYVDDATLDRLYRGATIFAYLSEYEGFGLPILEAMRYGVPVLTSNRTSLPEVAGSAAMIVETDVPSITRGLKELLTNEELCRQLSRLGVARAAEFSWEDTARSTGEVYLRALQ